MNGSTPHWSVIPLSIRLRQLHPVLKLRRAEQVFCKEFSVWGTTRIMLVFIFNIERKYRLRNCIRECAVALAHLLAEFGERDIPYTPTDHQ